MGIIDNLGYVAKAQVYACAHPDIILTIQAAGAAAAPVLLSALSFGCNDIIKMRAGISPWHSRKIKALIEGAIPADQKDAVNQIYKYTIPIQKALFFFFIVDLTTEFFARWHSQMFKLGACNEFPSDCEKMGTLATWVQPTYEAWTPIAYSLESMSGRCPPGLGQRFEVQAHQNFNCWFSLTPKAFNEGEVIRSFAIRLVQTTKVDFELPENKGEIPWFGNTPRASYMFSNNDNRGVYREYEFQAFSDVPAYGVSGSCAIQWSDRPIYNKGIIPVNCFGVPAPTHSPV